MDCKNKRYNMSGCDGNKKILKEFLNREITEKERSTAFHHARECRECMEELKALENFKPYYSGLTLKHSLPELFDEELHIKLVKRAHSMKRNFFSTLTVPVFSFSLIIVALFFIFKPHSLVKTDFELPENSTLISKSEADRGESLTVELEYDALRKIEDVNVLIKLDKGVVFDSKNPLIKKRESLVWRGDLRKGRNLIPFSVRAVENGRFFIDTKADFEGFSHVHKVVLDVGDKKIVISYYKLPDRKIEHVF